MDFVKSEKDNNTQNNRVTKMYNVKKPKFLGLGVNHVSTIRL